MSRIRRLLLANHTHHLLRKSRRGEPIFLADEDYRHCQEQIRQLRLDYHIAVHAWSLAPDRLHIIVTPEDDPRHLSRFMKALTCRISLRRRKLRAESASWDRQFRCSVLEPGEWTLANLCYVEHPPTRSPYTSHKMRRGRTDENWLDDLPEYVELGDTNEERAKAFRVYMRKAFGDLETKTIEKALRGHRPIGSKQFTDYLHRIYGDPVS